MSDIVISVENINKAYRLGQIGSGTLKEDLSRWWAKLLGKPDPFVRIGQEAHARKVGEQFWALDDVTCNALLIALVDAKFLRRTPFGTYARADQGVP